MSKPRYTRRGFLRYEFNIMDIFNFKWKLQVKKVSFRVDLISAGHIYPLSKLVNIYMVHLKTLNCSNETLSEICEMLNQRTLYSNCCF